MADVVEKRLDMSLDQIADERKQEQRSQNNNSNSNNSNGGGNGDRSFRPRDRSPSPIGSGNGGGGGKAKNARRADRIAHSAPYQSRVPRFNNNNNKGNQQRFGSRELIEPGLWTEKRVYVGNLSWNVTWQMLKDHMRQVGDEVVNVEILESGGRSKGCAIVTFRHPSAALKAIAQLNDTELAGRKIFVRKDREDVRQPPRINSGCRVYVGNLSWNVKWQELKDHMKKAGNVVHADVLEEPNGRSKGCGLVEYATPQEAQEAIHLLTNTELEGRLIFVREDREPEGGSISMIKNRALGRNGNGGGNGGNGGQFVPHNMPYYPPPPVHHPHHHQLQYPPPPLHHQFQHMPQYPPAGVGGVDGRQIYIGNLPWDTHWESLRELFQTVGDVERTEIPQYPDGRSRGFGIVRFFNAQDAWQAIERYDRAEVNGRVIEVRLDRRGQ